MKVLLFIKRLLKNTINNNFLVLVLNLLKNANNSYFSFITVLIVVICLFISAIRISFPSVIIPFPYIMYFTKLALQFFFITVYSINILILVYAIIFKHNMPERVLKYSNIKGTSKISNLFSNFIEYYYPSLPVCMMTTGIALATLSICHEYFLFFGVILFAIGYLVFFLLRSFKSTFYNMRTYNAYNNINRANDILTNYISPKETNKKYLAIKAFTKHFMRVLDGIDFHFDAVFDKVINIDSLQNNENITVKQLLKRYLPIYLSFCSETELNSFKIKMNSMVNMIDNENMIVSLDIIKIVHSIHQDIVTFLNQHSYVVPENSLISNLKYKANKIYEILADILVSIFVIIGLFKYFIPSEIQNQIFDTFSNLLAHNADYIALIPPFIASILAFYHILKKYLNKT